MTRVLYIGVGKPWLGGAGYLVRQSVFLRALSDAADELHLALFDADDATAAPPPFAAGLTPLPRPTRPKAGRIGNLIADLTSPLPRTFRGYDLTAPRAAVAALHPGRFDAVFAFRIDFAHYAGVLDHPRLILDVDDPEHIRSFRRAHSTAAGTDRRSLADLDKLAAFERAAEGRAKLAFVCQSNDLRGGWPLTPEVVPNTIPLPPAPVRAVTKPVVLFVGNCAGSAQSPNVDAVRYFLADVWPAVRRAVPDAEFHLVGATGDAARAAVEPAPAAVLRGFVDDLAEAYSTAAVSIAPLRFGTGTRIKILEAMAHACPVLSTATGAEGIEAVVGREIEIADGPEPIARRLAGLLTDRVAAERIGAAGRLLIERTYDADAERRRLAARFREFLHGPAAGDRKAAG